MPILIYGMNHASAPLPMRERVAVPPADLVPAVRRLVGLDGVEEGLILSTCNRTEILVNAREPRAAEALKGFLSGERQVGPEDLDRHCYLHAGQGAVRHLFRVAASLDSMVVGEAQILGQVKEAYAAALEAGGLKTTLDTLLQRAFSVAKRVRTETGIARTPVSIAHAAADLARNIFGDLRKRSILILGAGKMGRLAARHLMRDGVLSVTVLNRSYQRAVELAAELRGEAAPYDRLAEELERADVIVASTAAPHTVVSYEAALRASRGRRGRPLFFIDIAVPRDVDPRVNDIDNVYLYDIDELKGQVEANLGERRHEAELAEAIVDRETAHYLAWMRTQQVAPAIVELRRRTLDLGMRELQRFHGRLASLGPEQRKIVEEFTVSLINKFLHHPTQALKQAAAREGNAGPLDLVREIFGLDGRASGPGAAEEPARERTAADGPPEAAATAVAPAKEPSAGRPDRGET